MNADILAEELLRDECRNGQPNLKPYRDSVRSEAHPEGILTIGVGRNLEDVGITKSEAMMLLTNDIERAEVDVEHRLPWYRSLSEGRQRVLVNMAFNMGIGRLLGFRRMLAACELGKFDVAVEEMLASQWAKQVGPRAVRLAEMMRTG